MLRIHYWQVSHNEAASGDLSVEDMIFIFFGNDIRAMYGVGMAEGDSALRSS